MQRRSRPAIAPFPWDDVQLFLALYRSRTMREAARALGVDTSTVSRRLGALEGALDTALFDRGREGISPTRSAEELLVAAERTEAAVASFASAADGLERDVAGVVRIACPPDMADVLVLPVLRDLFAAHPRLRVVLEPGEGAVDLVRREADLAVRTVRPTRGDLLARRILVVRALPCASAELAERLGPITDVAEIPWIGWGERFARIPMARWIERFGGEPVLRTDRLTTQIAAAQAGLGVALVPHPSVGPYDLARLRFADPESEPARSLPVDDLFIVTHRTLRQVPRVKVVWEALVDSLQSFCGAV